jgi:transposase InsO family protein
VAQKWNFTDRRKKLGRPGTPKTIQDLVVQMARENPTWGYDHIQGALANLGHDVSDTTVGNILRAHGIEPAPQRRRTSTWKTFLKAHWDVLAAIDFTTVEVWSRYGLVTYYLLAVMDLATRRVHLTGITANPDEAWMKRMARNLTAVDDGFLTGKRYLLMDRDAKFSEGFRTILRESEVKSVRLPPCSPNLNAHLERYWLSLKTECLNRLIFFGEAMLRRSLLAYGLYYHRERNHQGLGNQVIEAGEEIGRCDGTVECRERLGGLLRYYYRAAA